MDTLSGRVELNIVASCVSPGSKEFRPWVWALYINTQKRTDPKARCKLRRASRGTTNSTNVRCLSRASLQNQRCRPQKTVRRLRAMRNLMQVTCSRPTAINQSPDAIQTKKATAPTRCLLPFRPTGFILSESPSGLCPHKRSERRPICISPRQQVAMSLLHARRLRKYLPDEAPWDQSGRCS